MGDSFSERNNSKQNLSRGLMPGDLGYEDFGEFKVKNAIVARPGWVLVSAD